MKKIRGAIAIVCAWQLAVPGFAQTEGRRNSGGFLSGFTRPYRAQEIPPVDLTNSSRLESLLRAGRIYLSLQDAIALALENNLDIAVQRYGPMIADAALLRAQAGGLLRGVPTAVQRATTSALAQVTGAAAGAGGTTTQAATTTTGGETGGAIIVQTGTAIPNLDPVLFTQTNFSHRTSPQTNSFTTGTNALIIRNDVANFGIQKGFLTGGTISFGWNNSRVETNAGRSDFNPSTTASFSLSIQQPLLRGFGLAVNNRNIRIAKNNRRVSDLAFRQQVITTVSAIISAYWDLVSFNENVRVKQQALALAEKLYEDNKKQVEIGTLAPIEVVRAEAEVASSRQALVQAETQLLQQETLIKNALSRTGVASPLIADARIVPTDRITVPPTEAISPVQDLIEAALKNRPDVAQIELQIENTRIGLKGSRNNLLPQLDVVADFRNNALVGQINKLPIPAIPGTSIGPQPRNPAAVDPFFIGGYGKALSQLFARNFPDYGIGFQLTVPLRNRSAQADMIVDQLTLRQQELRRQALLNQVRVDVRNALIALQQARAAYEAAVKARELQE
ncbi:MAG: TolC family protein, partial [Bryobacteraceae bacterium]